MEILIAWANAETQYRAFSVHYSPGRSPFWLVKVWTSRPDASFRGGSDGEGRGASILDAANRALAKCEARSVMMR